MKVRSITVFTDLSLGEPELPLALAANFLHRAVPVFASAGFEVQTSRVASQPFPHILASSGPGLAVAYARRVEELAHSYGVDYLALGPVGAADDPGFVEAIPAMLAETESLFLAINIADTQHGIDLALVRRAAEAIRQVSALTDDGLSNLFLAAIANCPPGAPFFPAAYHAPGEPMNFALALQAADLALQAVQDAACVTEAMERLTDAVMAAATRLTELAESLAAQFEISFTGLDFSLAPFPDEATSLGGAMERLGASLGGSGAAAAAAAIMSALDGATFPRIGFCGLLLPVLEDAVLATCVAEGRLDVTDLLLYSAVCGTGLDTLPLPGDISPEALAGILLDVAALALRLDKPLTARLMPLPGKRAGDETGLEHFPYFAPGRVMAAPRGLVAGGLLAGEGQLHLKPRRKTL